MTERRSPPYSLDRVRLEQEVRIETFRASGPGGQNLHKTESAVRVVHPLSGVSVTAMDTRSQTRNREIAFERLIERLKKLNYVRKPRKKTRPTRSSVERRLTAKRHQSDRKRTRSSRGET